MKPALAGIIAAAAMMAPTASENAPRELKWIGSIIPPKDYKRRQKRLKMQKDSRKANRK